MAEAITLNNGGGRNTAIDMTNETLVQTLERLNSELKAVKLSISRDALEYLVKELQVELSDIKRTLSARQVAPTVSQTDIEQEINRIVTKEFITEKYRNR